MSAVLKALRKLETDRKNTGFPNPGNSGGKSKYASDALSGSGFLRKGMLVIVLLAAAAWAFGYLYNRRPAWLVERIPGRFFSRQPKPAPAPFSAGAHRVPQPAPPVKAPARKPIVPSFQGQIPEKPLPESKPPLSKQMVPSAPGTAPPSPIEKPARIPARTRVKAPLPKRAAGKPDLYTGKDLKLQAVAWSSRSAERIAVINGLIVREGDSVEGYAIAEIQQEAVLIRRDASTKRLVFATQ